MAEQISPLPTSGVIGVAVNGVLFMTHTMSHIFDDCLGHVDPDHTYHYHGPPICLLNSLMISADASALRADWWYDGQWPPSADPSPLIGWALDGWPIFGPYDEHRELMMGQGGPSRGGHYDRHPTLDTCNGKVLSDGSYAYFVTPNQPYTINCFRGIPGSASSRDPEASWKRCPRVGLASEYSPAAALRPALCEVCEATFFLFPTCPKLEWSQNGPIVIGAIYWVICAVSVIHAIRLVMQYMCDLNSGGPNPAVLGVWINHSLKNARKIKPFYERWLEGTTIGEVLRMMRFTFVLVTCRDGAPLLTLLWVSSTRAFFFLLDPYYSKRRFPPFVVAFAFGLVYPALNNIFRDIIINVLRFLNEVPRGNNKYVLAANSVGYINLVTQIFADFFRSVGVSPAMNHWLMMCQVAFLSIGWFYSFIYVYFACRIYSISRYVDPHIRRLVRLNVALVGCFACVFVLLLLHSTFNLGVVPLNIFIHDWRLQSRYLLTELMIIGCLFILSISVVSFDNQAANFVRPAGRFSKTFSVYDLIRLSDREMDSYRIADDGEGREGGTSSGRGAEKASTLEGEGGQKRPGGTVCYICGRDEVDGKCLACVGQFNEDGLLEVGISEDDFGPGPRVNSRTHRSENVPAAGINSRTHREPSQMLATAELPDADFAILDSVGVRENTNRDMCGECCGPTCGPSGHY